MTAGLRSASSRSRRHIKYKNSGALADARRAEEDGHASAPEDVVKLEVAGAHVEAAAAVGLAVPENAIG